MVSPKARWINLASSLNPVEAILSTFFLPKTFSPISGWHRFTIESNHCSLEFFNIVLWLAISDIGKGGIG
jgi:hypothetical protein